MLSRLTIRDIVLIERLDLDGHAGLTVLTGETGAGKSILLDAFTLALGGRGDGALVRHGAAQGQVTAAFELPGGHPALDLARAAGLDVEDELILRRTQFGDGRTRAFVNDVSVSVQVLRGLGAALVEVHGQHDDRALLDPAGHRRMLDAYGGLQALAATVRDIHARRRALDEQVAAESAALEAGRAEADYLRHVAAELEALAPEPGEEDALAVRRSEMQAAAKVVGDLRDAYDAVSGNGSPVSTLAALVRRLERRAGQAQALIEPCTQALDGVLTALDAAEAALGEALAAASGDPGVLEKVEERLFALRAAARKHGVAADELPRVGAEAAARLGSLDAGEGRLKTLAVDRAAAEAAYRDAATRLSAGRQSAADALDGAVNAELPPLKLERARFTTTVASEPEAAGSPDGLDRVEFWVATNPGSKPGPLSKVASGGELSRFMLALKVSLAGRGSAPTLVFDEIDTGTGGAVADAIGRRLARLAGSVQVLAVTHAPQVAARAATHLRIAKGATAGADAMVTDVALLDAPARREEIARMLAGATVTDEARAAATRLLDATGS